jgi:gas vesicle protein
VVVLSGHFLAGVVVGVTVGILVAPDSGANTRKKLKEKLGQYWGESPL